MNLIYREDQLDLFATVEDFEDLEEAISLDLERIKIALETCQGKKDILIKTLNSLSQNLSFDMISLTDNYVALNIQLPKSATKELIPNLVIIKRNMREIYFLNEIESAIVIGSDDSSHDMVLKEYAVRHYSWYEDSLKDYAFIQTEHFKDHTNPALSHTDEFVAKLKLQNIEMDQ